MGISRKNTLGIINALKTKNFKVTVIDAEGNSGQVKMILVITKRNNIKKVVKIINEFNPKAFYVIEDIRSAVELPASHKSFFDFIKHFTPFKKAK